MDFPSMGDTATQASMPIVGNVMRAERELLTVVNTPPA
jgi:hypothetical protein